MNQQAFSTGSRQYAIGSQAFAETQLTSISIPASVTTIGNAAFAPIPTLANLALDEGNTAFSLIHGILTATGGKRLLVTAHQAPNALTALNNGQVFRDRARSTCRSARALPRHCQKPRSGYRRPQKNARHSNRRAFRQRPRARPRG